MNAWPPLPLEDWVDTLETVHLWTQVLGRFKLAASPFVNQWWSVGLQLTAHGLSTGLVPVGDRSVELILDLVESRLRIETSDGAAHSLTLSPRPVADFYAEVTAALGRLAVDSPIDPHPAEMPDPIPFDRDTTHASYDAEAARRWWRAMLSVERVLQRFRTGYEAKSSPILFYWGGFDLNHTRFTGRRIPQPDDAGLIRRFGENEENFAVGFWPGSRDAPEAVLYAYASPAPSGIEGMQVEPTAATFAPALGEFVLPYAAARSTPDPDEAAMTFFTSSYAACAERGGWDRSRLEGPVPAPWTSGTTA